MADEPRELPLGFFYRADGSAGLLGVQSPDGSVIIKSQDGYGEENVPLSEVDDSPSIERGEQCTITHTFRMAYLLAMELIKTLYRGMIYTEEGPDGWPYYFFILSARVDRVKGKMATLTVVSESKSFDVPPDEFSIVPVELGLSIMKHPRYFYAFLGQGYGTYTEQQNQMVIRLLQDYMENTSANYREALILLLKQSVSPSLNDANIAGAGATQPPKWQLNSAKTDFQFPAGALVSGTDMAKRAALEIITKYWRGTETPYVVGYEFTHSYYSFISPPLCPGGYVENPLSTVFGPEVPEYFWSRTFPPSGETIFDFITTANPQCYSASGLSGGDLQISWLRKADQVDYQRTWFKSTRTWIGTPVGYWDTELYTQGPRPLSPDDYLLVNKVAPG